MSLRGLAIFTCLFFPVLAFSGGDSCADPQIDEKQFRKHEDAAVAFFRVGAFDKAINEFEKAYAVQPLRKLLFNLARACEENGEKERSVEYFKRYLASPGDIDDTRRAEANARMVALERAIAAEAATESEFAKHKRTGAAFFRVRAFDKAIDEFEHKSLRSVFSSTWHEPLRRQATRKAPSPIFNDS